MGEDSLIVFLGDLVLVIMTVILIRLREDNLVTVNKGKIAHIYDTIGTIIIFDSTRYIFIIQLSRMIVRIMRHLMHPIYVPLLQIVVLWCLVVE